MHRWTRRLGEPVVAERLERFVREEAAFRDGRRHVWETGWDESDDTIHGWLTGATLRDRITALAGGPGEQAQSAAVEVLDDPGPVR